MHVLVIVIVAGILIYLFLNSRQRASYSAGGASALPAPVAGSTAADHPFVYVSKGKLFLVANGNEVEEIHSAYAQDVIDRMNRARQRHGWKENTSLGRSFTGRDMDLAADQVELQVASACFSGDNKLLYVLKDRNVGGLFEFDMANKTERRVLHQQNLLLGDLAFNPRNGNMLCSQQHNNGIANIVLLRNDGRDVQQLSEGDTVDSSPAWLPDDDKKILFQTSGLARSEQGYIIAHGPAAIKMLDLENNAVTSIFEDAATDYLQPRVDRAGNLYFIRRPYELHRYDGQTMVMDFLLFPFRLLRAVFHWLNFFSLMYSRKPLTSASGPLVKQDLKELIVKGKRIDAEKAMRKESSVGGIPSLVPKSWQLVKRTQAGAESVLATNVASFDITSGDTILYSNGYAVFQLGPDNRQSVVLRDKLIGDIAAS